MKKIVNSINGENNTNPISENIISNIIDFSKYEYTLAHNKIVFDEQKKFELAFHPIFRNKYWIRMTDMLETEPYIEKTNNLAKNEVLIELTNRKDYPRCSE